MQPLTDAPVRSAHSALPLNSLASVGNSLANRPYARRGVSMSADTISVLLVDDHTILRDGVKALLRAVPDIVVVGEAANGVDALAETRLRAPRVVVLDLDMPGGDGASALAALMALEHPPRVLILTMHAEEERLIPLLTAGASGYLMKDVADRELADAIRVVAGGDVYVRPRVARLLAASVRPHIGLPSTSVVAEQWAILSERERSVLQLIAEGFSGPEIGRSLGISAKTVDTYKQRIEEKLGLAHRSEYVRFALAAGLFDNQHDWNAPAARAAAAGPDRP